MVALPNRDGSLRSAPMPLGVAGAQFRSGRSPLKHVMCRARTSFSLTEWADLHRKFDNPIRGRRRMRELVHNCGIWIASHWAIEFVLRFGELLARLVTRLPCQVSKRETAFDGMSFRKVGQSGVEAVGQSAAVNVEGLEDLTDLAHRQAPVEAPADDVKVF